MKEIEKYVKKQGVCRFILRASITALPFYKNLGYRVIRRIRNIRKGDEFLMERKL
jgi:Acetyltransferase (GNAT) domain